MPVGKRQREEFCRKRAREMAHSGDFADHLEIQTRLELDGYAEVYDAVDRRFLRQDLDNICKAAAAKKAQRKEP